jgi:condensin complex subunit 1
MAEQAINTIYLLGEQPDQLCTDMLRNFTAKVFATPSSSDLTLPASGKGVDGEGVGEGEGEAGEPPATPRTARNIVPDTPFSMADMADGEGDGEAGDVTVMQESPSKGKGPVPHLERSESMLSGSQTPVPGVDASGGAAGAGATGDADAAPAFTLAQLVFVVGHVAVKHIVYLELVEREFKRRKDEKAKGECRCAERGGKNAWVELGVPVTRKKRQDERSRSAGHLNAAWRATSNKAHLDIPIRGRRRWRKRRR